MTRIHLTPHDNPGGHNTCTKIELAMNLDGLSRATLVIVTFVLRQRLTLPLQTTQFLPVSKRQVRETSLAVARRKSCNESQADLTNSARGCDTANAHPKPDGLTFKAMMKPKLKDAHRKCRHRSIENTFVAKRRKEVPER